ncbi:MAG TPA: DMT family transporter [Chthonomonadaceae bacterium]|nr:DMT family transporter [Chthonomonadaceae bacterium]
MIWIWAGLAAGAGLAAQAAINSRLGRELGNPALATLASFLTGIVLVATYCVVVRAQLPSAAALLRVPAWAWLGGSLGAAYVATIIVVTPKIGVGTMSGLAVGGQMATAVVLDHFGALGLERHPVTPARIAGVVLVVAGVFLLKRF